MVLRAVESGVTRASMFFPVRLTCFLLNSYSYSYSYYFPSSSSSSSPCAVVVRRTPTPLLRVCVCRVYACVCLRSFMRYLGTCICFPPKIEARVLATLSLHIWTFLTECYYIKGPYISGQNGSHQKFDISMCRAERVLPSDPMASPCFVLFMGIVSNSMLVRYSTLLLRGTIVNRTKYCW